MMHTGRLSKNNRGAEIQVGTVRRMGIDGKILAMGQDEKILLPGCEKKDGTVHNLEGKIVGHQQMGKRTYRKLPRKLGAIYLRRPILYGRHHRRRFRKQ